MVHSHWTERAPLAHFVHDFFFCATTTQNENNSKNRAMWMHIYTVNSLIVRSVSLKWINERSKTNKSNNKMYIKIMQCVHIAKKSHKWSVCLQRMYGWKRRDLPIRIMKKKKKTSKQTKWKENKVKMKYDLCRIKNTSWIASFIFVAFNALYEKSYLRSRSYIDWRKMH